MLDRENLGAVVVKGARGSVAKTAVKKPAGAKASAATAGKMPGASKAASGGVGTKLIATPRAGANHKAIAGKSASKSILRPSGVVTHRQSTKLDKKRLPQEPRFPNNAPVPLAPVPTNGKPRKNQAGLSVKEL